MNIRLTIYLLLSLFAVPATALGNLTITGTRAQVTIQPDTFELRAHETRVNFGNSFDYTVSALGSTVTQNTTVNGNIITSTAKVTLVPGAERGSGSATCRIDITTSTDQYVSLAGFCDSSGNYARVYVGSASFFGPTPSSSSLFGQSTGRAAFDQLVYLEAGNHRLEFECTAEDGRTGIATSGEYDVTMTFHGTSPPAGFVFDASRTGSPAGVVADAEVTLFVGEEVFATTTTNASGRIIFPDPAPDLTQPYDVWIYKELMENGTVVQTTQRAYSGVRLVGPNAVQLVLPVNLHTQLDTQLKILEAPGTLVLPYNTATARTLMEDWNTAQPELPSVQTARNAALGRLLSAVEGLAGAYAATEPVAKDGAKLIVGTILSFASMKQAVESLAQSASNTTANAVAQGTTSNAVATVAMSYIETAVKDLADYAKDQYVESLKGSVPDAQSVLVATALETAIGGAAVAFGSVEWEGAELRAGAMKSFLESLAETLAEQVGGRVLASAYVHHNNPHLQSAAARARNQDGSGTVGAGYVESQAVVTDMSVRSSIALDASATADTIATQFGYVADITQVAAAGGAAFLAPVTAVIRVMSTGALATATANDFKTLYDFTYTDTVKVPDLAFFPNNSSVPSPLPGPVDSGPGLPFKGPRDIGTRVLPPGYQTALTAMRARIAAGDQAGSLADAEALLAEDAVLKAAEQATLTVMQAMAQSADPSRPALGAAVNGMRLAGTELRLLCAEMHGSIAGWLLPALADPETTQATILAQMDAVSDSITEFNDTTATAVAAAAGLAPMPVVAVTENGIVGASIAGKAAPGNALLRATVVNAGDVAATGVSAQLVPDNPVGPVTVIELLGTATQALGTLAPGESRTVDWNVILSDVSPSGIGTGAAYQIILTATTGITTNAIGTVNIVTPSTSFQNWAAGFPGLGELDGFGDDADRDGIRNGLERLLGRHPLVPDPSPIGIQGASGAPFLEHSRSYAPGSDATTTYEWSTNLLDWQASGATADNLTVQLEPTIASGSGTGLKTIRVIPQITGSSDKLFYRLGTSENPPTVDPPAPVAPIITVPPAGGEIAPSEPFTFSVTATGTGPLIYQWKKNGIDISGANESDYTKPDWQPEDSGSYSVRIIGVGGVVTSIAVALTVQ